MTLSTTVKATIQHVDQETYTRYRALWKDVTARTPPGGCLEGEDFDAVTAALKLVTRRPELRTLVAIHVLTGSGSGNGLYGTLPDGTVVSLGIHSLFKNWTAPKHKKTPGRKTARTEKAQAEKAKKVQDAANALSALSPDDLQALLAQLQRS